MTYNANIPMANDILSDSQVALLTNFGALNTSFGIDHYTFNDLTANNGFHKVVHTPSQASSPSTHPATTTNPIFYAAVDNPTLGILQYSRGPNNAVQGPLTSLQSSANGITLATFGSNTAVLDFSGVPYCYGILTWAFNQSSAAGVGGALISWTGSAKTVINIQQTGTILTVALFSGNVLQIVNNAGFSLTNLSWTLNLNRIFTPT